MKYFKVQKGYGAEDYISIDETELQTALRAQVTGKVAMFKNGSVSGNHIISVTADPSQSEKIYNPSGPDYLPKNVEADYRLSIENAKELVTAQLEGRKPELKTLEPVKVYTQGMTSLGSLLEKRKV